MFLFFETVFEKLGSVFFLSVLSLFLFLFFPCFYAGSATAVASVPYILVSGAEAASSELVPGKKRGAMDSLHAADPKVSQISEKVQVPEKKMTPEAINQQIEEKNEQVKQVIDREDTVMDELDSIEMLLNQTSIKAMVITSELESLNSEVDRLLSNREVLKREINANESYLKVRLNALYRMKMMGQTTVAPMADSLFDWVVVRHNAMETIVESDCRLLKKQQHNLKEFAAIEERLKKSRNEKKQLNLELSRDMALIKGQKEDKNRLLAMIRGEKRAGLAAIEALKLAAIKLDREVKALKATQESKPSSIPFADLSGRLDMPVKGRIISTFGPEKNRNYTAFTFQSGIDIKVDRGEPVKSVYEGKVIYSNWLKGYGNIMIIDHGDSYYTLYAYLEERFKQKGALVDTSEVIATAGDTGSMKGPCLHFEIRHHGTPVNPLKWLKKGV